MVTIAERFIELLENKETSVYGCSNDTGIPQRTLGRYRNGESKPNKTNRKILAEYFGVSVAYIMAEEEKTDIKKEEPVFPLFKEKVIDYLISSDDLESPYLKFKNSTYSKKDLIKEVNKGSQLSYELLNDLIIGAMVSLDKGEVQLQNFELYK